MKLLATIGLLAVLVPGAVFAASEVAALQRQNAAAEAEGIDISSEAEVSDAFSEDATDESPSAAAKYVQSKGEKNLESSASMRQAGRSRKRGYNYVVTPPSYYTTSRSSYSKMDSYSVPWSTPTTYSKSDYELSPNTYYYPSTKTQYTSDSYTAPLSTKSDSISGFSYRTTYRPAVAYYNRPITTYISRSTDYGPYSKSASDFSTREYYYRPRTAVYRPVSYYAPSKTETTYSKDSDFDSYSLDSELTKGYYSRTSYRPTTWTTYEYRPSSYSLADSKGYELEEYGPSTYYTNTYYSRPAYYTQRAKPAVYRTTYGRPTTTYTYPLVTRTTRLLRNRQPALKEDQGGTKAPTAADTAAEEASRSREEEARVQVESPDKPVASKTSSADESKDPAVQMATEPSLPGVEELAQ